MSRQIIPECYADTILISLLGFKKPNHQHSIGDVIRTLDKHHANRVGIGFIDKDKARKGQAEHNEYTQVKAHGNIVLKRKIGTSQYLIMHPNIEAWLISIAHDLEVDFKKIPSKPKQLGERIKNENLEGDQGFKDFVNTLCQKKTSPLKVVKKWIDELLEG